MNLGEQRPRRIITGLSLHDVQLNKAENAWKPGRNRGSLQADPEAQGTQDLFKKVQSILNKLTPENFPQLMKQVMDLPINTEERLKGVVDLVFEKAIDEPSFSVTYGNMCRGLAQLKVPTTDDPKVTVNFIKLLRCGCKKEFDKDKEDDDLLTKKMELDSAASTDRDRLQEELQEAEGIIRRRAVGNVKFIGELYKLKMITTANIQYCIDKMLEDYNEKSLECLCTLLTTIGRSFDLVVAKPEMDQYFKQIKTIITAQKMSSRIRFLLQDVVDLRLHNWVSRKPNQGPKTIEQIHREALIEEQEVQRKVEQQLLSKKQPDPSKQRDLPWKSVSTWNNSRTIDPNKSPTFSKPFNLVARGPPPWKSVNVDVQLHKSENVWKPGRSRESLPAEYPKISRPQLKPQMDEKIQLGPRAPVTCVKGSSGGAEASDSERARTAGLNHISVLQSPPSPPPSTTPPPESKRIPEPVKPEPVVQTVAKPARSEDSVQIMKPRATMPYPPKGTAAPYYVPQPINLAMQTPRRIIRGLSLQHVRMKKSENGWKPGWNRESLPAEKPPISRPQLKPQMDEKIQLGPRAPVTCVKGSSGGAEASDSERARTAGLNHISVLQSPPSPPPSTTPPPERSSIREPVTVKPEPVIQSPLQEKLQCLQTEASSSEATQSEKLWYHGEMIQQMHRILLDDMANDKQIFNCVKRNLDKSPVSSPPCLKELMTALCKAAQKGNTTCRLHTALFQKRWPVVVKTCNSESERQQEALKELQALIFALDGPPNLLRIFYYCLRDKNIISEALQSVTDFFTWLREAEAEAEVN